MKLVKSIPNSLKRHIPSKTDKISKALLEIDMSDPDSNKVLYLTGEWALTDKEIVSVRTALSKMKYNDGPEIYRGIVTTTAVGDYLPNSQRREFYIQRLQ